MKQKQKNGFEKRIEVQDRIKLSREVNTLRRD